MPVVLVASTIFVFDHHDLVSPDTNCESDDSNTKIVGISMAMEDDWLSSQVIDCIRLHSLTI